MSGFRIVAIVIGVAIALGLAGCYPYPAYTPVPVASSAPPNFDASWQAARGAASDEGVRITYDDKANGTMRGESGSSSVLITVARQADGSIHVAFTVSGQPSGDTNLQDRLARSYQRRMGR